MFINTDVIKGWSHFEKETQAGACISADKTTEIITIMESTIKLHVALYTTAALATSGGTKIITTVKSIVSYTHDTLYLQQQHLHAATSEIAEIITLRDCDM